MPLVVILAAVAVAISVPMLVWAATGPRSPNRAVASNLSGGLHLTDMRQIVLSRSTTDRAVKPLIQGLADRARKLTPASRLAKLEHRIVVAGRPAGFSIDRVLAGKMVLAIAGSAIAFLLLSQGFSLRRVVLAVAAVVLGWYLPDLLLYSRGRERQTTITLKLPDTLDQMTICVEAGLGFDAAMARAGRNGTGPLADELVRTLQEVHLGIGRAEALRNLADRTDVPDVRHFTNALIQAEGYGVPIAEVLKSQAAELRLKRRQRAEERAMQIPVKIVFPLVVCILPTLFIVIIGPAAIRIAQNLNL